MLTRKRLGAVSAERLAESRAYDAARQKAWNRDRGECKAAAAFPAVECWGRVDPHHVAPVGRYPELRCDPDNIVCVCRRHHDHIHAHPLQAKEEGLLK